MGEAMHEKITVEGEIEVCSGCRNSLGYNVSWDQAHSMRDAVASAVRSGFYGLSGDPDDEDYAIADAILAEFDVTPKGPTA